MKNKFWQTATGTLLGLLMFGFVLAPPVFAQLTIIEDDQFNQRQSNDLTGTWEVTVTRPEGTTFLSLMTFTESGQALEESNNSALRSLAHGEWVSTGNRRFTRTWVYFRFVPTNDPLNPRQFIGTNRNTANMVLTRDLRTFYSAACSQLYDVNGNLEGTRRCLNETGNRLEMNTITEQPNEPRLR